MTGFLEQMTGEINETEKDVKKLDKENKALNQKLRRLQHLLATKTTIVGYQHQWFLQKRKPQRQKKQANSIYPLLFK